VSQKRPGGPVLDWYDRVDMLDDRWEALLDWCEPDETTGCDLVEPSEATG
jgi:hypothetical protein